MGRGAIGDQPRHQHAGMTGLVLGNHPNRERGQFNRTPMQRGGHLGGDHLVIHRDVRAGAHEGGLGGRGFQAAIVRTQIRACSGLVIPG
jgi:hypothetical protein